MIAALRTSAERFATLVSSLQADFDRHCRRGEYGEITLRQCSTLPLESVDEHMDQIDRALSATGDVR